MALRRWQGEPATLDIYYVVCLPLSLLFWILPSHFLKTKPLGFHRNYSFLQHCPAPLPISHQLRKGSVPTEANQSYVLGNFAFGFWKRNLFLCRHMQNFGMFLCGDNTGDCHEKRRKNTRRETEASHGKK
jgi:hypothetical protein